MEGMAETTEAEQQNGCTDCKSVAVNFVPMAHAHFGICQFYPALEVCTMYLRSRPAM